MQEGMLRKAIYTVGSVKQLARKLGIHREHIYAWVKGVSKIPLEYALQIDYLTQGEIHWKDLVPVHVVQRLKHLTLLLPKIDLPPCELVYVSIERIKESNDYFFNKSLNYIDKERNGLLSLDRPICLDTENKIIFGKKVVCNYEKRAKRTVPAWRLSLLDLVNGQYSTELFLKSFLVSERVAIGRALEKFLGKRQGYRSDLVLRKQQNENRGKVTLKDLPESKLVNKSTEVPFKRWSTRQIIAARLGFGSHFTYQNAKKISLYGDDKLIGQVDRGELSIYKGSRLCKSVLEKEGNEPRGQNPEVYQKKKKIFLSNKYI